MSDEDQEAKDLMAKLGMDNDIGADDESDEELDPEEVLEQYRRDVTIDPDNCIDQVLLATSDLEKAVEEFEKLTGVKPVGVRSMNGLGTKSARIAFEECAYLEIIGPDPKQELSTPLKEAVAKLPAGELVPLHYAVRWEKSKELEVRREWKEKGMECDQITMVAKDKGMPWLWDMYFMKGDGICPFITDYSSHDSIHACSKLPIVGTLTSVCVSAPEDHIVHKLLESPQGVTLSTGSPKLEFTISTKNGSKTFSTTEPIGIAFPDEAPIG